MARLVAVSGSASGIGAATARLLRERGDTVIGIDLHDADVQADLSTPEGRASAVDGVLTQTEGPLDVVIACAGLSGLDPALVRVNYFGATELLAGLRPALAAAAQPRAAVVTSISGTQPLDEDLVAACLDDDEPAAVTLAEQAVADGRGRQLYPSSKSALSQWVRRTCIAPGWADAGIPLNGIAPGVVRTPMSEPLFADTAMKKVMDTAVPMPLNGYAQPEVIARALAWQVSEENTHTTGQILYVDGGAEASLRGPSAF